MFFEPGDPIEYDGATVDRWLLRVIIAGVLGGIGVMAHALWWTP